ncbi:hypothetical protein CTI12_AA630520 [Artemisia annua]|uniref:Uncharacterized protein n=1 Tax=Artemisia annua TaxID=35608 RepID=A0A2U1K8Z8_ARTAN|nr:hypothetical protein CTI12_AA630520 [Artemisia annua]
MISVTCQMRSLAGQFVIGRNHYDNLPKLYISSQVRAFHDLVVMVIMVFLYLLTKLIGVYLYHVSRLLPYHIVADYEAEEDDRILDADTTGQVLSHNGIKALPTKFWNSLPPLRNKSEESLLVEQALLQEERQALFETRSEMEKQQKAGRDAHAANMIMAAMAQEQQARAEMMSRAPIRASAMGSMAEQEQDES